MIMGFGVANESLGTSGISSSVITTVEISNAIYDDLYSSKYSEDLSRLPSEKWTLDTNFHSKFNGTIYGGNVDFGVDNTSNILIKRRKAGEFQWMTIHDRPATCAEDYSFTIEDPYTPIGKVEYAIVPIINDLESEYIVGEIDYYFDGVMLIEKDNIVWTVANINLSEQKNGQASIVNTLQGEYPYAFNTGENNYFTGTLSAVYFDMVEYLRNRQIDTTKIENIIKLHTHYASIMEFLNNKKPKVLKYDDGRIRMIVVTTPPTDNSDEHHDFHTIDFSYTEIGNVYSNEDMNDYGFLDVSEEWWVK